MGAGGKNLALYMPRFNFGGSPMSKMPTFQIAKLDFQAPDLKSHLAPEPKVLKLDGYFSFNQSLLLCLKGII